MALPDPRAPQLAPGHPYMQICDRLDTIVEISTEHQDYFVKNMIAIRAEKRLALVVKRPAAFVAHVDRVYRIQFGKSARFGTIFSNSAAMLSTGSPSAIFSFPCCTFALAQRFGSSAASIELRRREIF